VRFRPLPGPVARATSGSRRFLSLSLVIAVFGIAAAAGTFRTAPRTPTAKRAIAFEEAAPLINRMRAQLPDPLRGLGQQDMRVAWRSWVAARDKQIRARLRQGDEDSVVHLWLFGTSFTARPRATDAYVLASGPDAAAALLQGRLEDLINAIGSAGSSLQDDRLIVARRVLEGAGIDLHTPAGAPEAARHLEALRVRMMRELRRFRNDTVHARQQGNTAAAFDAYLRYYRARGLSTDTSLLASYSVERTLAQATATLAPRRIRRVAVVGPGLDFADKAEGHDFYPLQTLQPFAVVDSLVRTGLADPQDVEVTTFDISPSVVAHLDHARTRSERDEGYLIHLALAPDDATHVWHPDVLAYWERFGDRIGRAVAPHPPPAGLEHVLVRAVRLGPRQMRVLRSRDLNIILERVPFPDDRSAFDLIVATNILVYYDEFEQALALANMAAMLRPDGVLVVNGLNPPLPHSGLSAPTAVDVRFDQQQGGDTLHWFRRDRVGR
jgi:SAM-dependent methyltransferase